ncbi:delta isoform of regulatory subunit B56, protein phosphatase 2A [Reticulomyxa filosa]|uniref:Delta isoform of regulatory subunit B56, protein phosphatase 2A n=1 Tax=Reticulomyxa filosa TaxID=46433 RepID=X6M756_RETFI|nr:delta isoform of regulatory subunit B56, protein phosphatase 2A [Reticulomyxa filosa]|eukprot:ETO09759.1 delta isoform of regulatory subunit B56, protein phosphatase 2A [Reticulomyxa filosa]
MLNLLDGFKSEDPRERDYLKTILHRIYGKFMSLRSFVRKAVNNIFFQIIYENEKHPGVAELLEILGSIINGFALPLKVEHQCFLRNVLIPLHKLSAQRLQTFHRQLSYCITQFLDKDNLLSGTVIEGLLKYWPVTSSTKEVLLLNELEEILELTPNSQLIMLLESIFKQLMKCGQSPHFQVAERALLFWNSDLILSLTAEHKHILFPIVVPTIYQVLSYIVKTKNIVFSYKTSTGTQMEKQHWNKTVQLLVGSVIKSLLDIDTDLRLKWEKIQQMAEQNDNNIKKSLQN